MPNKTTTLAMYGLGDYWGLLHVSTFCNEFARTNRGDNPLLGSPRHHFS